MSNRAKFVEFMSIWRDYSALAANMSDQQFLEFHIGLNAKIYRSNPDVRGSPANITGIFPVCDVGPAE